MTLVRLRPLLGLALILSGCATAAPSPKVQVQLVKVPTPVACAPALGPDPAYADNPAALAQAPDLYQRVKLLLQGRTERDQRLAVLSAALKACLAVGQGQ